MGFESAVYRGAYLRLEHPPSGGRHAFVFRPRPSSPAPAPRRARVPWLPSEALPRVREGIRDLLARTPELGGAPRLAERLREGLEAAARVVADQVAEELRLTAEVQAAQEPVLAEAMEFGDAARQAGGTIASLRKGLDFPNFVNSLITGVFEAITKSNLRQLEQISELLKNVGASAGEFTAANISPAQAVQWALETFPFLRPGSGGAQLTLAEGVKLGDPTVQSQLLAGLGVPKAQLGRISAGDLDKTLLPLARKAMGKHKQGSLATMVMMGLNRIVVDEGRMHASMDLRVDTSSIQEDATNNRVEAGVDAGVSGSAVGTGWGASGAVSTKVGMVHDTQSASREEISTQAGMRSSVDLVFHTEPINLDQMASAELRKNILARTPVPNAAWTTGSITKGDRLTQARAGDQMTVKTGPAPAPPSLGPVGGEPGGDPTDPEPEVQGRGRGV